MRAKTTRRRLSLLSLPVVAGVGVLAVTRLALWQQSRLVADLAEGIAHSQTQQAIEAIHKLAAMANPPIHALVDASAVDQHEIAKTSQLAISRLLFRWEQEIESKQRISLISSQVTELAQTIADNLSKFSTTDTDWPWLDVTARKILRIANTIPPPKTPLVAVNCDAILTAIDAGHPVLKPNGAPVLEKSGQTLKPPIGAETVASSSVIGEHDEDESSLGRESPVSTRPKLASDGSADTSLDEKAKTTESERPRLTSNARSKPSLRFGDELTADGNDDSSASRSSRHGGQPSDEVGETADRTTSLNGASTKSNASRSIFRILSTAPVDNPVGEPELSDRVTQDPRSTSKDGAPMSSADSAAKDPLHSVQSRELLRRWLAAKDGDNGAVGRELAERGFGRLTKRIVRKFFSEDPRQRMRVVDDALAEPGAGSEPWLLLLAEDSDADVRLFAVTLMATSNNAALMEKAWQIAIRDHDPRIADLAGRLRDRRSATLRR
ncbi:MAG TPA: hypothetical protein VHE81_01170 [Lacipirellulaceae bacterium]|nr:hypothetical protein [Lacipirellulaceae bacterium]